MLKFLVIAFSLVTAGCSGTLGLTPYRIEIQQGNYITQEMVAQLKPGMTRDQVRFVLGTPLVSDIFHKDRWDYVYTRQLADSGAVEYRRLAVFFEDDKLKRIGGSMESGAPSLSSQADSK